MNIIADDRVDGKHECHKCGSSKIEIGKFDPVNGTITKCLECGDVTVINHQDFDDASMGSVEPVSETE